MYSGPDLTRINADTEAHARALREKAAPGYAALLGVAKLLRDADEGPVDSVKFLHYITEQAKAALKATER